MKLVLEKLFWVVEDGMVNGTENNVMQDKIQKIILMIRERSEGNVRNITKEKWVGCSDGPAFE